MVVITFLLYFYTFLFFLFKDDTNEKTINRKRKLVLEIQEPLESASANIDKSNNEVFLLLFLFIIFSMFVNLKMLYAKKLDYSLSKFFHFYILNFIFLFYVFSLMAILFIYGLYFRFL